MNIDPTPAPPERVAREPEPGPERDAVSASLMIRTIDLRVDYGALTAVNHVCLEVEAGEIYGLIGPNGAGKTSTIKVLATLQEPTYGEVWLGGFDAREQRAEVHRVLGYMPDFAPVYDALTVVEFLELFAGSYGVARRRVDEVIELAGLGEWRRTRAGKLSRGWQQRLVLGKTLLHDPKVLLLDEPASGLDPMARLELRRIIRQQADAGKTILISSHILSELSSFCTSFGIMARGELRMSGSLAQLNARLSPHRRVAVELLAADPRAAEVLRDDPATLEVRPRADAPAGRALEVTFEGGDEVAARLLTDVVRAGVAVKAFYDLRADVEDVFFQVGASSP